MHEQAISALDQRAAITSLKETITVRWPTAVILSADELTARFPKQSFIAGWTLPAAEVDAPCDLVLAIPNLFPNALPHVGLADPPPPATLPHIDAAGLVCLNNSLVEFPADIRHAEAVVSDAITVIKEGLEGKNRGDFLEEVSTYWTLGQPISSAIWYYPKSLGGTRSLYALAHNTATVLSESKEAVKAWAHNIKPAAENNPLKDSAVIHFPEPIFPNDYPAHTGELLVLVSKAGPDAIDLLARVIQPGEQASLLLTFEHNGNLQLLGIRVNAGTRLGTGHGSRTFWDGYRKGHMPKDEFLRRIAAARYAVIRTDAVRIDSDFLLNRTVGRPALSLSMVKVAVVGCGALGAQVALLLAQSGVRHLTLVDHDTMSWQNVGRHVLSGMAVGHNKASAMKEEILSRFPDYEIEAIPKKWQDKWSEQPNIFDSHDLVISLTADWESDSLLNSLSKSGNEIPPVIFSWIEAFGLAGHIVTVLPQGGCLRCMTNSLGEFQHPVAAIPEERALHREPSCGAFYQPFSAAAAVPLTAQVVMTAIEALNGRINSSEHRVWVGAKDNFDYVAATITPDWHDVLKQRGYEKVYRTQLQNSGTCQVCQPTA